jgi:hypothetical protein
MRNFARMALRMFGFLAVGAPKMKASQIAQLVDNQEHLVLFSGNFEHGFTPVCLQVPSGWVSKRTLAFPERSARFEAMYRAFSLDLSHDPQAFHPSSDSKRSMVGLF